MLPDDVVSLIPDSFPVRPLGDGDDRPSKSTCGHCGLSWDDGIPTAYTPSPSGRCPFEYFHLYPEEHPAAPVTVSYRVHSWCGSVADPELVNTVVVLESNGEWDVMESEEDSRPRRTFKGPTAELEALAYGKRIALAYADPRVKMSD